MKPATTLRELLNPPFSHDHCGAGEVYCGVNKADYKTSRLAQIRGWGFFQYFENGEQLQDEFKDFAVNALNEKWERDFGEPLRWVKLIDPCEPDRPYDEYKCPRCGYNVCSQKGWLLGEGYNFCSNCGQQISPPDGLKSCPHCGGEQEGNR